MYLFHFGLMRQVFSGIKNRRYWTVRYVPFFFLLFLVTMLSRLWTVPFQLLDYVLFPDFRKTKLEDPVYILSAPRSGSTFLHRLFVQDEQFVSIKLWHTIFPSVTFYKLVDVFFRIENALPVQPVQGLLNLIDRISFSGWDDMHKTGLRLHEEDEQWWMQIFASPVGMLLFFPFLHLYKDMYWLDRLPQAQRDKLAQYLKICNQRFMYVHPGKRLLAKNAVSGGRIGLYKQAMPDMRVVYIKRDTAATIPSALSMFTKPWAFHSPELHGSSSETEEFVRLLLLNLLGYENFIAREDLAAKSEVAYAEMIKDPFGTVERVYEELGLTMSEEYAEVLREQSEASKSYKSKHKYSLEEFGVTTQYIDDLQSEIFN